jgi:hypothetical protein
MLGRLTALALVSVALVACQDATLPFEATDRPDESQSLPRQLTFSEADDRSPAWDPGTDAVLFSTEGFPPFVAAPGLLLAVPSGGGAATELLPDLQFPGGPRDWFASPTPSPGGGRMAWAELWGVRDSNLCPGTGVTCATELPTEGVAPRLAEVRLRVASADTGSANRVLRVSMEGLAELPSSGGLTSYAVSLHPFQALFHLEGSAVFRPSWSPSGDRLAFSDGLRLLIWSVDGGDPAPIPSTEDGVHAAWSPDGEWIAFTRLVRGEPVAFECLHSVLLGPVCRQERVEYPIQGRVVTVVRPDGSDATEVGPGDDPAWLPDSQTLVFRRQGTLWTAKRDGSSSAQVTGTEGGREPAPSPDGTAVVFARIDPRFMTHDLWVVALGGDAR